MQIQFCTQEGFYMIAIVWHSTNQRNYLSELKYVINIFTNVNFNITNSNIVVAFSIFLAINMAPHGGLVFSIWYLI